jgi:hypothetical protein
MTAFAQKPSGITANSALQTMADQQSERFMLVAQNFEEMFLQIADITIDLSRDIYKENKSLSVKTTGKEGFVKKISWKDVDMDDDSFQMKAFSVSALPSSPSGRLQSVADLLSFGFIDSLRAQELLDFPDLKRHKTLQLSSLHETRRILDLIKHNGEYTEPPPEMDLNLAVQEAQREVLAASSAGVPEDRIVMMRKWIDNCLELQEPEPEPQPLPAPVDPMGQPAPPPVNPGLPQSGVVPDPSAMPM